MRFFGFWTLLLAMSVAACGRGDEVETGVVGSWHPDPALIDAAAKAYGEEEFQQNRAFAEPGAESAFLRDLARLSGNSTMGKSAPEIADVARSVLVKQRITLNADGSATALPSQRAYTGRWTRTGDRLEVVFEFGAVMRVVTVFVVGDHQFTLQSVEDTLESKPPSAATRRSREAMQVKRWVRAEG